MMELDRVEVRVRGINSLKVLDMSTIVVENICLNIRNSQSEIARTRCKHRQGLHLADVWCKDDEKNNLEIDWLIGLDQYWSVAGDEVIQGKEGPLSIALKFGYIISGQFSVKKTTEKDHTLQNLTTFTIL